MIEIDHEGTDNIVCPYCGHVHTECYEYRDDTEVWCENCDEKFWSSRYTKVTYTTSKIKD